MLYINGMNEKTFKFLKFLVTAFLAALMFLAILRTQLALAVIAGIAGNLIPDDRSYDR